MNTNYTVAKLNAAATAPKGQPHDRQHHNVINGLPATRWTDWDEALKLRNEEVKQ
jgi:hypothetical protein